ncbi:hypothetical protein Tco_1267094, partial [Tanacetum coccineum]
MKTQKYMKLDDDITDQDEESQFTYGIQCNTTDTVHRAVTQPLFTPNASTSNCFRSMHTHNDQTGSKEHLDILHLIVYQQPLTTLNHAYLCLDAKDCIIRPEIIRFPNSNQETGHWSHLTEEHSRGRTKSA